MSPFPQICGGRPDEIFVPPNRVLGSAQHFHSSTSAHTNETREARNLEDNGNNEQAIGEREVVVEEAVALVGEEPLVTALWPSPPSLDRS